MQKTSIIKINQADLEKLIESASETVAKGGLIVLPTDTVYGISCDALNAESVEKVYAVKERDRSKPFPVCVSGMAMFSEYAGEISPETVKLVKTFWPGPLTVIVDTKPGSGFNGRTGFRMPDSALMQQISGAARAPLISTSANVSGSPCAQTIDEILNEFDGKVDLVLSQDEPLSGKASTVIDMSGKHPGILRIGSIDADAVRNCLDIKIKRILIVCTGNSCRSVMAEGMMKELLKHRLDVSVLSAGTYAYNGSPAALPAIQVMSEIGINISEKRSHALTSRMVDEADVILVMTKEQKNAVISRAGDAEKAEMKTNLLMDYSSKTTDRGRDVPDPVGMPAQVYRKCLESMRPAIENFAGSI